MFDTHWVQLRIPIGCVEGRQAQLWVQENRQLWQSIMSGQATEAEADADRSSCAQLQGFFCTTFPLDHA
jgi:hypothetical protein